MICDPKEREGSRARGDDPDSLPARYARMTNAALAGRPADMVVTMHSCRGNFRSTFIASGGYEPVAEQLLGEIDLDGYFLEYDTDRAGGFEPLRFVPKGKKQVVLGLVTSKSGTLEKKGRPQAAHRRGDEICRARPALPVAAMRLRLDRRRQCARRGGTMGEAADDRGAGGRGLGPMRPIQPPFRADHVGSLLRPPALKEARARRERGEISAEALKAIEDREIERVIRRQEEIGLKSITDGEFRRAFWNYDFLGELDGVEAYLGERKIKFQGPQPKPMMLRVTGKLGAFSGHPMIEHFRFVQEHTRAAPKMTIPSPSSLHFRYGRDAVPASIYPAMDDFYRDLGQTYRKAVRAFADAGCRYLQLDEVNFAYLCDPNLRQHVSGRGDDPDALPGIYAGMINTAISDIPADMTIAMHLCRGNFQSTFVASGGYEPVAEVLFNTVKVHGYFMEYDSERAGGFEPLRFVPKGKMVVLGLVTSKSGRLEAKDEIKRRIDQASKFVPIDQLALSPQCGFASSEEGNILAEEEQWAKLAMIVELADEVWG